MSAYSNNILYSSCNVTHRLKKQRTLKTKNCEMIGRKEIQKNLVAIKKCLKNLIVIQTLFLKSLLVEI